MKNNKLILITALILAILAAYFIAQKSGFTIKKELRDFAVEDTASIDKIFLADKTGKKVLLEKKGIGNWLVNNEYVVRNEAVNLLLQTIKNLEVKNPVALAAEENVLRHMASNAIKVEIYQNKRLKKTYYVGGATQDQLGTFMLLENSSAPFVMHLPELNGYLTTRYFTDLNQWRSRSIFGIRYSEIKSVEVNYPSKPEHSFYMLKDGIKTIQLGERAQSALVPLIDTLKAVSYLMQYKNIQYEQIVSNIAPSKKDSILRSEPMAVIQLESRQGDKTNIKLFAMPITERSLIQEYDGENLIHDSDRMFGWINDKDFVIVQHFVFDKLLVVKKEFN